MKLAILFVYVTTHYGGYSAAAVGYQFEVRPELCEQVAEVVKQELTQEFDRVVKTKCVFKGE